MKHEKDKKAIASKIRDRVFIDKYSINEIIAEYIHNKTRKNT